MTVTEASRPSDAETSSSTAAVRRDTWFDTADHKRLGHLYLGVSALALLAGLVAALAYPLPGVADAVDVWTADGSRPASAAVTLVFVLGIAPAWIGLATYLVPLQVGATRLALPRLHAFAWWLHLTGAVIAVAGYLRDRPAGGGLGSPVPAAAESEPILATELWIVGLGLVALAAALAWLGLVTTILTRRAEGMRVRDVAPFTWSVLATGVTALLATPVFAAGMLLLYVDHHYAGTLFADADSGGLAVWLKTLWLYGRPDIYLLVAPAVGVLSEVVATAARRPLFPEPAARAAIAAAALLGLTAWFADVGVADAAVLPTYNVLTTAAAAPFGLAVLVWIGTMLQGRPRISPGVLHAAAFAALLGAGSLLPVIAAIVGLDETESVAFANGQLTLVVLGPAVVALAAAVDYWAPKLFGRRAAAAVSPLAVLAALGGAAVAALGQYLVAFGVAGAEIVTTVGLALVAGAVLLAVASVAGRGEMTSADPYDGLTLEWLAASPPPRYNFDELPPIRSAYPLYDLRESAEATADTAEAVEA
jgi:cytochrome c oxidase subunit 1